MKGCRMVSFVRQSVLAALCLIVIIGGCTNSRTLNRNDHDPMKWEYDTFIQVPKECLSKIKDTVEKKFGTDYAFKNTIRSREKPYREAIFSRIEGATADSTVMVKFDSLCVIKKIYRSMMIVSPEESR
jgi:hypothetical protein